MFSEYASKFLAQSQSRLSNFQGQDNNDTSPMHQRQANDWHHSRPYRQGGRSFLSAARGAGPYQPTASRFGNLTFASRYSTTQDAPLFHSELREQDDEDDRDREAVDLFALQQSRRVFQPARLEESTEPEDDGSRGSLDHSAEQAESRAFLDRGHTRGIRSSWTGAKSSFARRDTGTGARRGGHEGIERYTTNGSDSSGKGKMEDVGLDSVVFNSNDPPQGLTREYSDEDDPPAFQTLRGTTRPARAPIRRDSASESELGPHPYPDPDAEATLSPESEIFKHDAFFAWVYLIALASMFATFVMVWLHTTPPSGSKPIGDTIYTVLRSSFHLLAVDTMVAIIVSFVWLAGLRYFVRPLVRLILVAVPIIMLSFSLYPFVSSFQGPAHGHTIQDVVMRWASILPGGFAILWIYMVWKGRHSVDKSIAILEFSSRILAANNALVLVGLAALASIVLWTWLWLAMFTRVFLGGSYSTGTLSRYIIQASSWWLGAYFLVMYLWTLSMVAGVQRATTAATVSQWYFHRNAVPKVASRDIVTAALNHAVTTIFGTISLSTLLAIVVRLPLLILPRRFAGLITSLFYTFMPTSIVALTNSLTLTYAAIHSQPLGESARSLSHMDFLGPQAPTTTLTPRAFKHSRSAPLLPYRLAKLLLHATRFIMATALGFAGWVMTARQLRLTVPEGSLKGSAYAYSVGMVASFIGWGILGAMEGILSSIVDGVIVCYGSETKMASGGGGYCMEAAQLFGTRGRRGMGPEEAL